jgi:hypothetical protein
MERVWTAAVCGIIAMLLALAPRVAAAQFNPGSSSNPFDRDAAPALALSFGGGSVRSFERDMQADLYALGAFSGRKSVDRYERVEAERPQPWQFYGRLGPMYFQNRLYSSDSGMQFSFRGTGPSLGGRIYIGIHSTFY